MLPLCYYYMARISCLFPHGAQNLHIRCNISHLLNSQFNTQEYFAIRRRYSPRRVCETQISKNTQAYFGDRRMLRTGFVSDDPLRTPTYSIKFHTQAYRSGHNEAVLKTSFVCLCNFLKALDFIGFFASSDALCEKRFSQFSRKFP